jgi:RNA polymerase sigma factor (sigma-70 family)
MTERWRLKSVLATAMSSLPVRHRQVIHNYYTGGKIMRQIGESMGVNESRVSQIYKAALERMASNLQSAAIRSVECVI